eukprot:6322480-Amphidinium_carterae.2
MDLVVIALHWNGGPDGPPTSALVAIPEHASHGVQGANPVWTDCLYTDGSFADSANVVVVMVTSTYLSKILRETTPQTAEVLSFVTEAPGAAPLGSTILATMTLPDVLQRGYWLHHDDNGALRYMVAGSVGEETFVSALEDDLPDEPGALLTEIIPIQSPPRRGAVRSRRPSVIALGPATNAKALAAMLSPPPAKSSSGNGAGAPAPATKSKAPPKAADKEALSQLLTAVSSLADRLASLEANQQQSHGMGPPPPVRPGASAAPPHPSAAACASSPCLPGAGFLPSSAAPPKASSVIGAPPTSSAAGAAAYEHSLMEARRLLSLTPVQASAHTEFREDAAAGMAGARERGADVELRSAVMRGGPEAQAALNLAMLNTLERLGGSRDRKGGDVDDELFYSFLAGDMTDGSTGKVELARGSQAMFRLSQAIERAPDKWIAQCNATAMRALGCDSTSPWSMALYGERCLRFRNEHVERLWAMLAHLHARLRRGEHDGAYANVCQFLKATELCTQTNHSWRVAWALTSLPEVRSAASTQIGSGLGHPAEYSAAIALLKDQQVVEAALKKSSEGGGAGFPGNSSSNNTNSNNSSKPKSGAPPSKKGGGKGSKDSAEDARGRARSGYIPRSLLIGAYTTQGQGVARSSEHSWVRRVLDEVLVLAQFRPPGSPPYDFLSINLNQNAQLPAHRDVHNLSVTWLASFGDHKGGMLWLEAIEDELDDPDADLHPLPEKLRGSAPPGLRGFILDIKNTWTSFSGLRYHAILPSRGTRLSISLFSPRHLWRLERSHWALLRELGFQTEHLKDWAENEAKKRCPGSQVESKASEASEQMPPPEDKKMPSLARADTQAAPRARCTLDSDATVDALLSSDEGEGTQQRRKTLRTRKGGSLPQPRRLSPQPQRGPSSMAALLY